MTREWKPGDVARIELANGVVHPVALRLPLHEGGWATATAKYVHTVHVVDARPIVVIDPEDREQVERLVEAYVAAMNARGRVGRGPVLTMQAALREFVNHTPPKPAEPTGLGAVVEDDEGVRWVRRSSHPARSWSADTGSFQRAADYADINAVRVITEGVTA